MISSEASELGKILDLCFCRCVGSEIYVGVDHIPI